MSDDRGASLGRTVREPGVVWCYHHDGGARTDTHIDTVVPPASAGFRWVHLNLADQRSLRWLEAESGLSSALLGPMLATDAQQRVAADGAGVALALPAFERALDPRALGHPALFRLALTPTLLVTGRSRPLHAGDLLRRRLEEGAAVTDAPSAFAMLLDTLVDNLFALALDLSTELLDAEASLIADEQAPDMRELVAARRQGAQLHRMAGSLRATLQRLEREPGLPSALAPVARDVQPRLAALEADIVGTQQQLRLLRDELDLQATQRTNQNVYLLSVLTAILAPATLVTGFFGMNTGGMPLAQAPHGTLVATIIAVVAAAGTTLLLRAMGLVRRG